MQPACIDSDCLVDNYIVRDYARDSNWWGGTDGYLLSTVKPSCQVDAVHLDSNK